MTGLLLSTNYKNNSFNSILVIINRLIKMVYYKPVKVTINILRLAKVIIEVGLQHHSFLDSIISDREAIFISKFWFLLCYFFGIKRTTLHHVLSSDRQADRMTEQYNESLPLCLQKLEAKWLGTAITNGEICLQQHQEYQHGSHTIWAQL